jgi:hypothetical protein
MTTVGMEQQRLLIGGEWTPASSGATFERADPLRADAVTVAAAHDPHQGRGCADGAGARGRGDHDRGRRRASASRSASWSAWHPGTRR